LLVEAMAQLAGFLVEATFNKPDETPRRAVLGQIEKAKFHRACRPGDQIELRGRLVSDLENAAQVDCEAFSSGERVAKATLTFVLLQVKSEKVHQQRRDLYSIWTQHLKLPLVIR
jgi:3-hydroxyacyl-[acyl-carrier-protein] dehydratase